MLQKKRAAANAVHSCLVSKKYDLNTLISNVQNKIDADIVMSIEQKFLEISDLGQRRICVQRLEQLLQPITYPAGKG